MVDKDYPVSYRRTITWGAIVAGTLIAVVVQFMLTLLGLSLGLSVVPEAAESGGAGTLGFGAGIWWLVSGCIALYLGGLVAGRMSQSVTRGEGAMHGLLMWTLTVVAGLFFAMSAVGSLIGGGASMLGSGISAAGSGIGKAMEQTNIGQMAGSMSSDPQIQDTTRKLMTQGPDAINKDEFIELLSTKGNMSRPDAEKRVNDMINAYNQAKQGIQQGMERAQEAGKTASKVGAAGAFLGFLMLLLGAGFSAWGGSKGAEKNLVV